MKSLDSIGGGHPAAKKSFLNIDIKRIIYQLIRFWYIPLASLLIALAIAFVKNRYAARIYPVSASIIIREDKDYSEGKLLYNNALVSFQRNYLNELYIIRSFPLIERVLKELNFGVTFYHAGNIKTSDAYEYIPVKATVFDDEASGSFAFTFEIKNNREYQLSEILDDEKANTQTFHYGDTVTYQGYKILIEVRNPETLLSYKDIPFTFHYQHPRFITGNYIGALSAQWAEEGAGVIDLNLSGPTPQKDIDFLNGLIRLYQEYDIEKKNLTASRTVEFISEQLLRITDSLQNVERNLERFKNNTTTTDLSMEALRLTQKLEGLETAKGELVLRGNYYDYLTDYINQTENLDQVILPTSVGISDPILTQLVSKMIDQQMEMKMFTRAENPLVIELRKRINEIKRDIVESVVNQKSTDKIKLDYVNKQIRDAEKQLGYLPVAERTLVSIQRNYNLLENLYIFLLQKRSEAAITRASNTSDIIVVNPPMLSGGAISPNVRMNYMLAILIGLSLPIGAFVVAELLNTKIQSKEDVEKMTSIPFIGGIGHKKTDNNNVVFNFPKSAVAESFRALRSNLNYFSNGKKNSIYLITSSISGEGKTFTTINLASVLALSGKKTLIVGADLRKPKLWQDFKLENNVGLSTYLAGLSEIPDIIQRTGYDHLDLVSGGPVPPNPSELLLTPRMTAFIETVQDRYEYILLDTPPLAVVTDAFVLANYADHSIFVVRQNYTPKDFLKNVDEYYSNGRLKNVSILLNDIIKSGPGYGYGYGYGNGYGYGYGYGYGRRKNGYGYYSE